ncbi:hypothetical protein [Marinobacterium sp. LSUCC0821]|nr:hypothetical protein [Marinobacterium sp. LSUCC0821]
MKNDSLCESIAAYPAGNALLEPGYEQHSSVGVILSEAKDREIYI